MQDTLYIKAQELTNSAIKTGVGNFEEHYSLCLKLLLEATRDECSWVRHCQMDPWNLMVIVPEELGCSLQHSGGGMLPHKAMALVEG